MWQPKLGNFGQGRFGLDNSVVDTLYIEQLQSSFIHLYFIYLILSVLDSAFLHTILCISYPWPWF